MHEYISQNKKTWTHFIVSYTCYLECIVSLILCSDSLVLFFLVFVAEQKKWWIREKLEEKKFNGKEMYNDSFGRGYIAELAFNYFLLCHFFCKVCSLDII